MNAYEFTTKEYVSPIDLQILDRTYNTLEQGHLAAVQAKSQLQEAISQLDMDASEDAYKAELVNQLQQIIADNTVYGNSYGALDKIISLGGDIVSNPGVQGRLRAQADRKAFLSNLDQMNLPSDFQEYFRAMNPYHYEDYYDDKGNVIGGSKWEPSKIPTKQFDRAKLMADAINMAAYEEGQSMSVRYLDANGNVTNDPSQAVGGQYFDITTSEWKRLTEDRIRESFMSVMNNTSGAWNAFNQEYDVALWKYNTLTDKEQSDPDNPYVKAITNEKGLTLTHDEYLDRMISGGIHAASYNRVKTTIEPNKTLTSYYQTQAASNATGLMEGLTVPSTMLNENYDNITKLGIAKDEAVAALKDIAEHFGMDLSNGVPSSDSVYNTAIAAYQQGNTNSMEFYYQYLYWMKQYLDAVDSEYNLTTNLSGVTNGLEAYNFVQATNMGTLLDNSDNNPYAQRLVKNINDEFGSDEWLALEVSNEIYNKLPQNLKDKTEINTQRNKRYLYLKKSETAEILQASKIFPGSTNHYYLKDKNDNITGTIRNVPVIRNLANDNLMHKNRQLLNKARAVVNTGLALSNDVISDQVIATPASTLTESQYYNLYNNGQINKDTYNFLNKEHYSEVRSKAQMQVYDPKDITIYGYNSDTGALELIPGDNEKSKVLQDIASFDFENNKDGMMSNAFSKIAGTGLLISIPHKEKTNAQGQNTSELNPDAPYKGQKNKTGKYDQYLVKGLLEPGLEDRIDNEPNVKAIMSVFKGNIKKLVFNFFTSKELPGIGNVQITCNGNNSYTYKVGDTTKELNTANEAQQYFELLYYLQDLYDNSKYTLDNINTDQTVYTIYTICTILNIDYTAFISALQRRKQALR